MHYLIAVTAFLASMSATAPTPAGGNSLADLIDGTASLAETDCTGLDEGTIAASGFICEEGTRGAEADAADGAQNDAGEGDDSEAAGNNNDAQGEAEDATADNNNNNNNAQNAAEDTAGDAAQQDEESAEDAEAGHNSSGGGDNAQQNEEDAQGNVQNVGDDAGTGGGDGAGVNLFDLALQGFQPVDCTGIDEAVVAASGFNCIDGTRGA